MREVEVISKDEELFLPTEEQGYAFLVGITGRRKSGKTFLLDDLMKTIWLKEFEKIYILSQTAELQTEYFGTWKGNIEYMDEWDTDFFNNLKEKAKAEMKKRKQKGKNRKKKQLIIIDDMSGNMREKLYQSNIDDFSFVGRHFGFSVVWLGQRITLFTPGFRQESDGFILFREENMQELRLLHREWGFGEMDDFIVNLVENTLEKHSFIILRNIGGVTHFFRLPTPEEQVQLFGQKC